MSPLSELNPAPGKMCSARFELAPDTKPIECQLLPGHGTAATQPEYLWHLGALPDGQQIVSWPK